MTETTRYKLMMILNNNDLLNYLYDLKFRWDNEKEFEDWDDYESAMKKFLANMKAECKFICGNKRPFGFRIELDDGAKVNIFVKNKGGNTICLATKAVK